MRRSSHTTRNHGTTLIELTIVILVLITIIGASLFTAKSIGTWRKGREAGEQLRMVYAAQRTFLAENPTAPVSSLTEEMLVPYLPNKADALPKIETLDGKFLSIKVDVTPPIVDAGQGAAYDPSGKPNDSLWDVGP